jgi:hypothetical protein
MSRTSLRTRRAEYRNAETARAAQITQAHAHGPNLAACTEHAAGVLQLLNDTVAVLIADGTIDLAKLARENVAARGLGTQGQWIGFPAAHALWERTSMTTDRRGRRIRVSIPEGD